MKRFLRVDRSKPRASASSPSDATLIRVVTPVQRSCTNASRALFVSPGTRLLARERKPTNRPSPLITPRNVAARASAPVEETLTRSVRPVRRSKTNTSAFPFQSP